jgi:hypothetical protein
MLQRPNEHKWRFFSTPDSDHIDDAFIGLREDIFKALSFDRERLSGLKWLTGWGISNKEYLVRLVRLRHQAISLELRGETRQADFYWKTLDRMLRVRWSDESLWKAVDDQCQSLSPNAAESDFKHRIIDEALLDVHLALLAGITDTSPTPNSIHELRRHLDWVGHWIDRSGMNKHQQPEFMFQLYTQSIGWLLDFDRTDDASLVAETWFKTVNLPEAQKESLYEPMAVIAAQLKLRRVITNLKGRTLDELSAQELDALSLELTDTRSSLEALAKKHNQFWGVYQCLAEAYRFSAIVDNLLMRYADSLLNLAKANSCIPDWRDYESIKQQIEHNLSVAQQELSRLDKQIQSTQGASLSAKGEEIKRQVDTGQSLASGYDKSQQAIRTSENAHRAAQRSVALEVKTIDRLDNDRFLHSLCQSLRYAYQKAISTGTQTSDQLNETWAGIAEPENLKLSAEQNTAAVMLLARALKGEINMSTSNSAPLIGDPYLIHLPDARTDRPRQALRVAATPSRKKMEPALMWLTSREGIPAKLACAFGAALLGAASIGAHMESVKLDGRAQLYDSIAAWNRTQAPETAIHLAQEYFGLAPLHPSTQREARVREGYREAVTLWTAQNAQQSDDRLQRQIDLYRNTVTTTHK